MNQVDGKVDLSRVKVPRAEQRLHVFGQASPAGSRRLDIGGHKAPPHGRAQISIRIGLAFALASSIAWTVVTLWTGDTPAVGFEMPASRAQTAPRLSPSGLGPIRFGMDVKEASRAFGSAISVEEGVNGCSFWSAPGIRRGTQLIALRGRLAYALLYQRGTATTRKIRVGDGLTRLRHRYRGKLHRGRSASLGGADQRLFVSRREGAAIYELEFDIVDSRVESISAGTRHIIETFGECS